MEQYIIKGGHPLVGEVEIGGAKNAALAILAAAIMTDETVLIDNLPDVNDINVLIDAIEGIGAKVHRVDRHTVKINGYFNGLSCPSGTDKIIAFFTAPVSNSAGQTRFPTFSRIAISTSSVPSSFKPCLVMSASRWHIPPV